MGLHIAGDMLHHPSTNMQWPTTPKPYLPPGYRFHPTDEELVVYYLANKVADFRFNVAAIGEVDLNKCEPWDLPERAKMGEKEWYFFSLKDRKYPTGLRTNRATMAGYWKATGKDREVMSVSTRYGAGRYIVGMKKTLVFYKGRAPKGEKTNWIMHEYRLEGEPSLFHLPNMACKDEWVVCRIFKKSNGGKKVLSEGSTDFDDHALPALLESPHTHTAGGGNIGVEDMSSNADKEQPTNDTLSSPPYTNSQGRSFVANCLPDPSIPTGYNANVWGSMGTSTEKPSSLPGLKYNDLSYSPVSADSGYPHLISSCQMSENLIHKPGIQAGILANVELHPTSATASEIGILLQQQQFLSSSKGQLHKAESTPGVEPQSSQLVQMYKDTSSWLGNMLINIHNHEEVASTPQAHHITNFNTHNILPLTNFANHGSDSSTACGNPAINQATNMELISEGFLINPQLCDFNRAITTAHHHHHHVGAVWASQY